MCRTRHLLCGVPPFLVGDISEHPPPAPRHGVLACWLYVLFPLGVLILTGLDARKTPAMLANYCHRAKTIHVPRPQFIAVGGWVVEGGAFRKGCPGEKY